MKSSIRDKAEGAAHEIKGALKQAAGKLCDNTKLQVEGACEKAAGKAQEKVGEFKKVLGK